MRVTGAVSGRRGRRGRAQGELEERDRRFKDLAERIPGLVYRVRVEPDLVVEFLNPWFETLTGLTVDVVYADPRWPERLVHPDDIEAFRDRHGSGVARYRIKGRDGIVHVEDHYAVQRHASGTVVVQGVAFDISARIETEEARTAAQREREEVAAQLRRTLGMQRTFLQSVSHELRTPLTSVLGLATVLRDQFSRLDPDTARHLADRIVANAERLHTLLADLLDVDRLMRGEFQPHLTVTDLGDLCRRVAATVDLHGHGLTVDVDHLPVRVDAPKVERMVENLLYNGVRHTPAGTSIWILAETRGHDVQLVVEDDGPGVDPGHLDVVFEAFRQGSLAAASPDPGTGIGLAIVAGFAEAHGGRAWHEPRPGGGSRFCILLPEASLEAARTID